MLSANTLLETELLLGPTLINFGLPAFRITDSLKIAESTILHAIKAEISFNNAGYVVAMLRRKRSSGAMAFIQNFMSERFNKSFTAKIQSLYTQEVMNALQINSCLADTCADLVIPSLLNAAAYEFEKFHPADDLNAFIGK